MKEMYYFIKWRLAKWTFADYLWFLGCGFMGAGGTDTILNPSQGMSYLYFIGAGCWFSVLAKGVVWDYNREQWQRYQKAKKALLEEIQG